MPTLFQEKVYKLCQSIPHGKVTTYKVLAEALNCKSYRAIGQALKKNPFAPEVPCHRVIASNLTPGGYQGEADGKAIKKKLQLLAKEGVLFKNRHLANKSKLFIP
jgi:methylated-DNA-[protein]-cysteine S-methyltransferase